MADTIKITAGDLKKYLSTFDETDFDNAVGSVVKDNSIFAYESRYKAWDYCYIFFCNLRYKYSKPEKITEEDKNLACLNLYSYLASWGMTRNSVMGNYNYKIFERLIDVIFLPKYKNLWYLDDKLREFYIKYHIDLDGFIKMGYNTELATVIPIFNGDLDEIVDLIYDLGEDIKKCLIGFTIAAGKTSVTDTLITKIMLGTLGCMPGFDTYFKVGAGFSKDGVGDCFKKEKIKIILLIAIFYLRILATKQNYLKDSKY